MFFYFFPVMERIVVDGSLCLCNKTWVSNKRYTFKKFGIS